jgi:FkbM family methyltransferase
MTVEKITVSKLVDGTLKALGDFTRSCSALAPALKSGRITYVDVGSAGGFPRPIALACRAGLIRVLAIDAARVKPLGKHMHCVQAAVSSDGGPMTLYHTRHPGCSSLRRPSAAALQRWPVKAYYDVVDETPVQTRALTEILSKQDLGEQILLKMDVQGIEGDLLASLGTELLQRIVGIEVEAQFFELYEGQKTFFDVYELMRSAGFYLKDMQKQGRFEGDYVECNCFFARDAANDEQRSVLDFWWKVNGLGRQLRWSDLRPDAIDRASRKWR